MLWLFWAPKTSFGYLGGSEGHFNQREGNSGAPGNPVDLWINDGPGYGKNGTYNAFMYTDHHVSIYETTPLSTPTFVYHAWQVCRSLRPCRCQHRTCVNKAFHDW